MAEVLARFAIHDHLAGVGVPPQDRHFELAEGGLKAVVGFLRLLDQLGRVKLDKGIPLLDRASIFDNPEDLQPAGPNLRNGNGG